MAAPRVAEHVAWHGTFALAMIPVGWRRVAVTILGSHVRSIFTKLDLLPERDYRRPVLASSPSSGPADHVVVRQCRATVPRSESAYL